MSMSTLFLKIFNMSMTAGWLILAVIVLRLLLQKAPKWISCLLWAFVAIRLLCPITIESTLSLVPSAEPVKEANFYSQEAVVDSGITFVDNFVNPVVEDAFVATPAINSNPLNVWLFLGSVIWIVGILAMLGYAVISCLRIHSKVSASLPLHDNVRICDAIQTSFILGIVKPLIFIPSDMNEQQRKHVLAHEEAHIRRLDHWWKPLGFLLLSVYWFHPLCWAAYILFCRDMELACDEKVIRNFALDDKKEYSDTLLDCSIRQKNFTACPLAFGEVGTKKRIRTVLNYKRPTFWVIILAVAACIAVAVCFLTNPPQKNGNPVPENVTSAEEPENNEVILKLVKMEGTYPYCSLHFQKIDSITGKVLPFETNWKDEGPVATSNLKDTQNTYYDYYDYYNYNNGDDTFYTLDYRFFDLEGNDSITVTVDGLECTVKIPREEYREVTLNQKLNIAENSTSAKSVDYARIYPNALVLFCTKGKESETERLGYSYGLLTKDSAGNDVLPELTHENFAFVDGNHMAFVCCFADAFPTDQTFYLRVTRFNYDDGFNNITNQIYDDYELNLD